MVSVLVGTQWGDEGKGKIVDFLAEEVDIVARYQGGANAGHTVVVGKNKYVFHLVPSGILHPGKICIIGNGTVVDPFSLVEEIKDLEKNGVDVRNRLLVAENAHLTLPYHKLLEKLEEKRKGKSAIGTTGRGIGTTYADKYSRLGIRVVDFLDESVFHEKLMAVMEFKNFLLQNYYGQKPVDTAFIESEYGKLREFIRPLVTDTALYLDEALKKGKKVLAEGAQGTFLDIDFGTYPYVTASHPVAGGACTGLGLAPHKITRVIGVAKAYTTRVGEGPFPAEVHGLLADTLRQTGNEFGATTGRPRRCGWFDCVMVKYSCKLNGCQEIVITKLDILSGLKKINIATGYRCGEKVLTAYPLQTKVFSEVTPVYKEMDGWSEDISHVRSFKKLPEAARRYLETIEELIETRISLVSVGSEREDIVVC